VAKANQSARSNTADTGQPSSAFSSRRRLHVLLGLLVLVAGFAVGWWVYQGWPVSLPDVPNIDMSGADPEVAEALTNARNEVERAPRSVEAWAKLAMILHAHNFADEAVVCYTAAGALDATNPFWPYLQGNLLQSGLNPASALPSLQRAARLAPADMPMPRLRLAELLLELGRVDEADKEFRTVLADHPGDVQAQFGLAQVTVSRQQYEDALHYLRGIAEDSYVRKRVCVLGAAVYERLGKHEDAERERRRLAELPDDPPWPDLVDQVGQLEVGLPARLRRARSLIQQNQTVDAVILMAETVRRYPKSDQAWVALGVAKEMAKDFTGAEQAIHKSIELAPDRADHRFTLGEFLQAQRRHKEAVASYRKAIELRPVDADTHFKLGVCLQEIGDLAGAVEAFRHTIRYKPDMTEARQRLEKLTGK
jgi:tetratricopeptide (TPR) repeat protein